MSVSPRHILEQGPVLRALASVAVAVVSGRPKQAPVVPGPWVSATLPPRSPALIRDYLRHVGGDPSWYRDRLPAHLFPQWGFPLASQALSVVPYPLERVMNAGCRFEQHAALPASEPLEVKARIESIDDDGRRALITQRIVTGTRSAPDALVAELRAFVPLSSDKSEKRDQASRNMKSKEKPVVPLDVREIGFLKIAADAGLDFAKLTGDFNPIHWVGPYARASGFRACILHGFSTLARAVEALNRTQFAGDPSRLHSVDVRFTRPLVLPARVGVYVGDAGSLYVGDAPGGGAYLEGRFDAAR
jgi:acyl dehydratase